MGGHPSRTLHLSDHLDAKATDVDAWVVDPNKGLALLTLSMLDEVPETAAMRFATLHSTVRLPTTRARLIDNVHPSVANLAASATAPTVPPAPKANVVED